MIMRYLLCQPVQDTFLPGTTQMRFVSHPLRFADAIGAARHISPVY